MDLRNRYQERSDDKETQYIPIPEIPVKRSDQYDTQQLSTDEIRRRIRQDQNENARQRQSGANRTGRMPYSSDNSSCERRYSASQPEIPYRSTGGYGDPFYHDDTKRRTPQGSPQRQADYRRNDDVRNVSNNRQVRSSPANAKRKSKPIWQSVLRLILVLIIAVFVIYSAIAIVGILRTNIVASASRERTEDAVSSSVVDNILVIGTDSRDIEADRGRSDSIILLSINSKSRTVYMTSFLRDVYVYINDSYGSGKLNAAYSYGGPELLMDTIESNYSIKIDDYVVVSFAACAAVIDAVGGVEITLSDDEANALNEILISEVNELMGDKRNDDLLECGGTYNLSGKQALSYSRIRYVGNADFERTSRQREVLSIALKKACKNPVALCGIFINALPNITTNIQGLSLYGYSLKAPFMLIGYDIAQQQIPSEGSFYSDYIDGEDVLVADFAENNNLLLETVYSGVFD